MTTTAPPLQQGDRTPVQQPVNSSPEDEEEGALPSDDIPQPSASIPSPTFLPSASRPPPDFPHSDIEEAIRQLASMQGTGAERGAYYKAGLRTAYAALTTYAQSLGVQGPELLQHLYSTYVLGEDMLERIAPYASTSTTLTSRAPSNTVVQQTKRRRVSLPYMVAPTSAAAAVPEVPSTCDVDELLLNEEDDQEEEGEDEDDGGDGVIPHSQAARETNNNSTFLPTTSNSRPKSPAVPNASPVVDTTQLIAAEPYYRGHQYPPTFPPRPPPIVRDNSSSWRRTNYPEPPQSSIAAPRAMQRRPPNIDRHSNIPELAADPAEVPPLLDRGTTFTPQQKFNNLIYCQLPQNSMRGFNDSPVDDTSSWDAMLANGIPPLSSTNANNNASPAQPDDDHLSDLTDDSDDDSSSSSESSASSSEDDSPVSGSTSGDNSRIRRDEDRDQGGSANHYFTEENNNNNTWGNNNIPPPPPPPPPQGSYDGPYEGPVSNAMHTSARFSRENLLEATAARSEGKFDLGNTIKSYGEEEESLASLSPTMKENQYSPHRVGIRHYPSLDYNEHK